MPACDGLPLLLGVLSRTLVPWHRRGGPLLIRVRVRVRVRVKVRSRVRSRFRVRVRVSSLIR